jgi:PPOX class probable F420-dependent enzyme
MLSASQRQFLDSHRVAHLATADGAARPHVVPVCYASTDSTLYITVDEKPKRTTVPLKRLRNIAENPAVALVIDQYDEDWTRLAWVMIHGRADILEEGSEHVAAQVLLRARYPQLNAMRIERLPVIAVRIERVASWGSLSAPA